MGVISHGDISKIRENIEDIEMRSVDFKASKMGKYFTYRKGNALIRAMYRTSLLENKIIALALASIQNAICPSSELGCSFSAQELRMIFNDISGNMYKKLKELENRLRKLNIACENNSLKHIEYISLFSQVAYENKELKLEFNAALKPYIIKPESNYTIFSLELMMAFKSEYSFRLYEILRSHFYRKKNISPEQFENEGVSIEISYSKLRLLLGTTNPNNINISDYLCQNQYPNYDNAVILSDSHKYRPGKEFKRSVIDSAITEINEKTDINVSITSKRSGIGGKTSSILFCIKKGSSVTESDYSKNQLIDECRSFINEELKISDIEKILSYAEYDIEKVRDIYAMTRTQHIDNITGWMICAIKNNYKAVPNQHKIHFKQFEERNVNYNDLEKLLLSN